MNTPPDQNSIPKVIALILVSIGIAWLVGRFDVSGLAKVNPISPAEYIQYQRGLHQHSFLHHFGVYLLLGGFYIGAVEFIANVVRLIIPKKAVP